MVTPSCRRAALVAAVASILVLRDAAGFPGRALRRGPSAPPAWRSRRRAAADDEGSPSSGVQPLGPGGVPLSPGEGSGGAAGAAGAPGFAGDAGNAGDGAGGLSTGEVVSAAENKFRSISELLDFIVRADGDVAAIPPHVLARYVDDLLDGSAFDYVVSERLSRCSRMRQEGSDAARAEEAALEKAEAFLRGFISAERRRRSKKAFEGMLAAALEGPPAFDREMRALEEAGALDESLNGYLEEVAGRLRQVQSVTGGQDSPLLSVISILRDRIKAEKQSAENPRLRTFAQCLATDDRAFRQQLIQADCRSLESLLELYGLVEESVAYVAGEEGAGETPQDVVKAALAEGGDEDARQQTLLEILEDVKAVIKAQAPNADIATLRD